MLAAVSVAATLAAFNAPGVPLTQAVAVTRAAEPAMFTGGARAPPKKKVVAKKAPAKKSAGPGKSQGLFSSGAAPTKAKTKLAISSKPTVQTFIDVSGQEYQEVSTFVPQFDEIGVLPPIGRWDPLRIREQGPERYRRFVEMEIKHGRLAMAAFLGVVTTYSGIRFPGYLSKAEGILFTDLPGGAISSWAALPTAAWAQIVLFISICETVWLKQDPAKDAGDVVPDDFPWARYPDGYEVWLGDGSTKAVGQEELILGKTWKLNAERNNGRAAMMGITGMLIHESLTGNPVFPIGETL